MSVIKNDYSYPLTDTMLKSTRLFTTPFFQQLFAVCTGNS
jgi:hypothetical protein